MTLADRRGLAAPVLGLAGALAVVALSCPAAGLAVADDPRAVFTITSPEITESSSLGVSTTNPGLVYTTNDSGDTATVYVLDASTGAVVGRTVLADVTAVDIEAISVGSDGDLVVADIGDNDEVRQAVTVYRIPQPGRGPAEVSPDEVSVRYSDGPRDAEAVLYDGESGRVFIVSKELNAEFYRSPPDVFSRSSAVLRPVATAPSIATDATFVPGTDLAVVRTYFAAVVYRYPTWERLASVTLPLQKQGESIAAAADGRNLLIGSEGADSEVLSVPMPRLPPDDTPAPGTEASPEPGSGQQDEPGRLEVAAWVVVLGAGGAAALLLAVGAIAFRRHRAGNA